MTPEKALIMALEIVDTCKTYGIDEEGCLHCPFNIAGCMMTDGNNTPKDWRASGLIKSIETDNYYIQQKVRKNERHRH